MTDSASKVPAAQETALFRAIAPAERSRARLVIICLLLLLWLVVLTILYLNTDRVVREDQSLVLCPPVVLQAGS